ncbi:DUF11 domain-containing protein [Candidatus Uabimicrobium amorphum]|uniref:DUF11 domain-containing protein n=1 Tax=Uabimicrobium amorphum TaxID=2596890 RepID=A0A5S9IV75_UABAM|nr:DUF11 domain-containing protein [Candidatus Uabimicrobium amorphum]BBM87175.1 hypothetical protein UABAM_05578 [Candidatus Uabimicrobium amorphum]
MNKINMLLVLLLAHSSLAMSELIVTIQCPKSLDIEYSLNFTVSVQNVGNKVVKNIKTRCYLPRGFTYQGHKTGKFVLKWFTAELEPKAVKNYHCLVKALNLGEYTLAAQVKTTENSYKTTRKIKIVSPQIEVTSRASNRMVFLNKQLEFITIIKNNGNGPAYDVVTKGILPASLEYTNSSPQGIFHPRRRKRLANIKWRFAKIAPGEEITLKVVVRVIGLREDDSGHAHSGIAQYSVITTVKDKEIHAHSRVRMM